MFEHAAKLQWEGIVSKNADAPYCSDRNESWLKIKTSQRGKFPVVGFVKDPTGVAALSLGKREGRDPVVYMGKAGVSGVVPHRFQPDPQAARRRRHREVEADEDDQEAEATWVEPGFQAEVEYRDITSEGLLRASSFKGFSKRN